MALVTIPKRSALSNRLVSSIPVLGPLIDAIVARRSGRGKPRKTKTRRVVATSIVAQSRTGRTRRRGRKSTMAGRGSTSVPDDQFRFNPIPVSVNTGVGSTHWKISGRPQALTDYDSDKAIRIEGFCRSASVITNTVSTTGLFGSTNNRVYGPAQLDPRLAAIASAFQYYAVRVARFTYVPAITSTYGAGTANNAPNQLLTFGILDNVDQTVEVTGTTDQQNIQVSSCDPSMTIQSLGTQSMTYSHNGTKVWNVDTSGSGDVDDDFQFALMGVSSSPSGIAAQSYGYFYVNYVVDLYSPNFIATSLGHSSEDYKSPDVALGVQHDCKDEKSQPLPVLGVQIFKEPPIPVRPVISPTKSLLAAELRDLRASHFKVMPKVKVTQEC